MSHASLNGPTTEAEREAWEQWLAERPPAVAALARRFEPWRCLRMTTNPGHYKPTGYGEQRDGSVTLTLAHGRDSYLPGVRVFGVEPDTVTPCGCGAWQYPLPEQVRFTERRFAAEQARRGDDGSSDEDAAS